MSIEAQKWKARNTRLSPRIYRWTTSKHYTTNTAQSLSNYIYTFMIQYGPYNIYAFDNRTEIRLKCIVDKQ